MPEGSPATDQRTAIERIADYIMTARINPIGQEEQEAARKYMFDALSTALPATAVVPKNMQAVRAAALKNQTGTAPVWFSQACSSVVAAAGANSAATVAFVPMDEAITPWLPQGAIVVAVALTVASQTGASMNDVFRAIAVGYEVGNFILFARRSLQTTWISCAAIATAAVLYETCEKELQVALSIARQTALSDAWPINSALSAQYGLEALETARQGHEGIPDILDDPQHHNFNFGDLPGHPMEICNAFTHNILNDGLSVHLLSPIRRLEALINDEKIEPDAITAIIVETNSAAIDLSNKTEPTTLHDVRQSIPYTLAIAAFEGVSALRNISESVLDDHEMKDLAKLVKLEPSPDLQKPWEKKRMSHAFVKISAYHKCFRSEGFPNFSWEDHERKFRTFTKSVASAEQQEAIINCVRGVHNKQPADLVNILQAMAPGGETSSSAQTALENITQATEQMAIQEKHSSATQRQR
jgi:2-methylcitrate dehydratase PrpD